MIAGRSGLSGANCKDFGYVSWLTKRYEDWATVWLEAHFVNQAPSYFVNLQETGSSEIGYP